MKPYRILITGSRDWQDRDTLNEALADVVRLIPAHQDIAIVHGAARGADTMADQWARVYGATVEAHPANWAKHGRKAGPIRNAVMVSTGADICLAFIKNGSAGATYTARLAEVARIPVRRFTA